MAFDIEVRTTRGKGRGVFALKRFKRNEVIEKCPIVPLKPRERRYCEETVLNTYMYPWHNLNDAAVVLGYGSIYNHSFSPNAKWKPDYRQEVMVYKAIKDIKKGEEITVDYNGEYGDEEPLWFEVRK